MVGRKQDQTPGAHDQGRQEQGCHCGQVCFEVLALVHLELDACNGSICQKSGYQHLIVPQRHD
jgi:hypothetical protein